MIGEKAVDPEAVERIPTRPEWLDDERDIVAILGAFLDKLDQRPVSARARMPGISVSKTTALGLYRHDESSDRTWALVRSLDGIVFDIRPSGKRQPYEPEYVGARLRFLEVSEAICRDWLARPRQQRYQEQWASAVEKQADAFADRGASLRARPVKVAERSAPEVVAAFARMGALSRVGLTLRQLSARAFWGHSKLLDSREDLLRQLFPTISLAPRPVLLQVYLPASCKGVLFIENQDTYLHALAGLPPAVGALALVFGAGFRGSADRIRAMDGVSLHYQAASDGQAREGFESWWFGERAADWSTWFWGDLDYSGMAILKALRLRFGDVQAWRAGYEPMLRRLRGGGGHAPDAADKSEQADPGMTGCRYADQVLLPAMREAGCFVDQEAV